MSNTSHVILIHLHLLKLHSCIFLIYDFIFLILKRFFFPVKNDGDYDFIAFPTGQWSFSDAFKWMDSLFTFIISFLGGKELKSLSVIGSLTFQCSAFTQLTYWRIVMIIKWHICSEFSLKCSSGERDLAAGRMFVITVISVVLLEKLATLFSITLWLCARVCVYVCVLRMFSHSYRCVLGCASAPAFYQCNSLSFKYLVKKMPRVWEIKSEEKSKSVGGQWKITLKTNTMVNRQGCGQKAGGLCCLKVDLNEELEPDTWIETTYEV